MGEWAMGDGRWAMGDGRWAMGDGRWAMGNGNDTENLSVYTAYRPTPIALSHGPWPIRQATGTSDRRSSPDDRAVSTMLAARRRTASSMALGSTLEKQIRSSDSPAGSG